MTKSMDELEVRSRLGDLFQQCYDHIDEGNDRHDLIITVLDILTLTKEGAAEFIKEVQEMSDGT